jgi:predicted transcriptional regulator of viral defense system
MKYIAPQRYYAEKCRVVRPKRTYSGLELLRHLVGQQGFNVFTSDQARQAAQDVGIRPGYVTEALYHLQKAGWIQRLKRDVYAVTEESGMGMPPHEYEIAMALVTPCAISHWTAMHYHHLTQQIPNTVFALTPTGTSIPRSIPTRQYHYIHIKPEFYFGFEKVWVGQSRILITDLERTLLDGLMAPQYCGDFQEVLHAFQMAKARMSLQKLINYALLLDVAVEKRLGWILERLGYEDTDLTRLLATPIKGYRKLDPSHGSEGPYNRKWMIRENV